MSYKGSTHIFIHRLIAASILLCLYTSSALAQNTYDLYVRNLNAESIDGKLYVTWTTRAGFSCQDIHVEVSTDSINDYKKIATYYGLCGDTSEKNYRLLVTNPIPNRLNYVRLQLGIFGHSYFVSERVIKVKNEVVILPHPLVQSSKLFFDNSLKQETTLELVNTKGVIVHTESTLDDFFTLHRDGLATGFYLYMLRQDGIIVQRGRLMVGQRL